MSLEKTQDELGRAVSTHEEFGGEGVSLKAVKTPIFKHYVRCTQSFTEQQVPACRRLNFELSLSCAAHEHTESQTHRARGAQLLPTLQQQFGIHPNYESKQKRTSTKKHSFRDKN